MALTTCPHCDANISDKATVCPYCRNPLFYKVCYRDYVKSPIPEYHHPKSWLTESLLLGLASFIMITIWCLPFAITSFIYALRVDDLWRTGDIDGAIRASNNARHYYKIGLWLGIVSWLICILIIVLIIFGIFAIEHN